MRGTSCRSRSVWRTSLEHVRVFVDVAKKGELPVTFGGHNKISLQRHGIIALMINIRVNRGILYKLGLNIGRGQCVK
jgi:hypothetical protein